MSIMIELKIKYIFFHKSLTKLRHQSHLVLNAYLFNVNNEKIIHHYLDDI
jgi:hypothetical protein